MSKEAERCGWCGTDPLYVAYHDEEWGQPMHDERRLFEHLCLEGFQCGLSWITVLRKRDNFNAAFHGFDPERVASMSEDDVERLCQDTGIIRNRAKIRSTINNARRLIDLHEANLTLDSLTWSFALDPPPDRPRSLEDLRANSPESEVLSKELKAHGFSFVGPTGIYAFMQSVGIVDDHIETCFVAKKNDK
jgi:DNA-3-methyladenine glycosylase I